MNEQNGVVEQACREIAGAFENVLSWKWDSRFQVVLAEFPVEEKERVRGILENSCSTVWESSTVGKAPAAVREIKDQLGGLMPGQLLFTTEPAQEAMVFGAWWPWGNGTTISLRVGPFDNSLPLPEQAMLAEQARDWFGL